MSEVNNTSDQFVCQYRPCGKPMSGPRNNSKGAPRKYCDVYCAAKSRAKKNPVYKETLYKVLHGMIERCEYKKFHQFHRYGGRGISVCQEWRKGASAFIAWAKSAGWRKGLQIDRIDNDGDYSPENCRFVERVVNMRNRSRTHGAESKYTGVRKNRGRWVSRCAIERKSVYLGSFGTEEEAAKARDEKMIEMGMPASMLNFPPAG